MTPAIAATGLRKSFGDKLVLDGIDLKNVTPGILLMTIAGSATGTASRSPRT